MLWLKLIRVSKRRPKKQAIIWANVDPNMMSLDHWVGADFAILPMQANNDQDLQHNLQLVFNQDVVHFHHNYVKFWSFCTQHH